MGKIKYAVSTELTPQAIKERLGLMRFLQKGEPRKEEINMGTIVNSTITAYYQGSKWFGKEVVIREYDFSSINYVGGKGIRCTITTNLPKHEVQTIFPPAKPREICDVLRDAMAVGTVGRMNYD